MDGQKHNASTRSTALSSFLTPIMKMETHSYDVASHCHVEHDVVIFVPLTLLLDLCLCGHSAKGTSHSGRSSQTYCIVYAVLGHLCAADCVTVHRDGCVDSAHYFSVEKRRAVCEHLG